MNSKWVFFWKKWRIFLNLRLQSTCPYDRFHEKTSPERNMIFQAFSNIERRFSVFLLKLFWRGCENCTSLVHRNTLMNSKWVFFWKKWRIFLNFFRPGAKIFWPSFLNISAGCLTWILRVQKEHFEEEKVFLEKYRFCEVFEFWAKHFLCLLSKKCRWGCQTWIYISMRFFEGTKTSKNVFFLPFLDIDQKISGFLSKLF